MMLAEKLKDKKIVCGSGSPRRQFLLKELGLDFEVRLRPVDETYPDTLQAEEIPLYLSNKKAEVLRPDLRNNELLITADTIVWLGEEALNKPADLEEAKAMVRRLSGRMHQVFTGVTISSKERSHSFFAETKVWFHPLSEEEVNFYVETYQPLDKAGAYGAQEWIGYVGVQKIEGTYFNVMGLPVAELYRELLRF